MQIGEYIRVIDVSEKLSRVGIVSYIHENQSKPQYDIIFDHNGVDNEETNVIESRIQKLQPFETNIHPNIYPSNDPFQIKEFGNSLFALKDYESAAKYYKYALKLLKQMNTLAMGSNVLVVSKSSFADISIGMVSAVLKNDSVIGATTYEIVYDNDDEEEDQEGVSIDRLTVLRQPTHNNNSSSSSNRSSGNNSVDEWQLQRSLYLNLSKCCIKSNAPGWAVKWSSMAIATTQFIIQNNSDRASSSSSSSNGLTQLHKQLADAYYVRAFAYLTAGRPNLASRDGTALAVYDTTRSQSVLAEVDTFLTQRRQLNRRLARDVAQWVDTAMSLSQSKAQSHTVKGTGMNTHIDDAHSTEDLLIESDEPLSKPIHEQEPQDVFNSPLETTSKLKSSATLVNVSLSLLLMVVLLTYFL